MIPHAAKGPHGTNHPSRSPSSSTKLTRNRLLAGRYRIQDLVCEGGMGRIYSALHEPLGSRVAIKVPLPGVLMGPEAARRFLAEAKAGSHLVHDHIVRVFDYGELPCGTPFMAMEWLEGEDLQDRLDREGPMRWSTIRPLALDLCRALAFAHERGVIHRDVKPANCFLARVGDVERLKVLDFGLVKSLERSWCGRTGDDSPLLGSLPYMAPEQCDAKSCDARADVYAVAALLYRCAVGRCLHGNGPPSSMLAQKLNARRPLPVELASESGMPVALASVIVTNLAIDPTKRLRNARELHDALRDLPYRTHVPRPSPLSNGIDDPAPTVTVDIRRVEDGEPRSGAKRWMAACQRSAAAVGLLLCLSLVALRDRTGVVASNRTQRVAPAAAYSINPEIPSTMTVGNSTTERQHAKAHDGALSGPRRESSPAVPTDADDTNQQRLRCTSPRVSEPDSSSVATEAPLVADARPNRGELHDDDSLDSIGTSARQRTGRDPDLLGARESEAIRMGASDTNTLHRRRTMPAPTTAKNPAPRSWRERLRAASRDIGRQCRSSEPSQSQAANVYYELRIGPDGRVSDPRRILPIDETSVSRCVLRRLMRIQLSSSGKYSPWLRYEVQFGTARD